MRVQYVEKERSERSAQVDLRQIQTRVSECLSKHDLYVFQMFRKDILNRKSIHSQLKPLVRVKGHTLGCVPVAIFSMTVKFSLRSLVNCIFSGNLSCRSRRKSVNCFTESRATYISFQDR